ncbi:MAG: hypothetical protein P4N60_15925 [Verrucomicrobiae bacterium]|nr:hypothetical protein [Verrucomicrobiae bacterium]
MKKQFPWRLLLAALVVGFISYAMALPSHGKKQAAKIQAVNHVDHVTFIPPFPRN